MELEPVKSPGCNKKLTVFNRTKGKTWDIVPGSETADGFAKVFKYDSEDYDDFYIKAADLGRTDSITLYKPVGTVYNGRRGATA